ncbi:MAG TPA: alkaline phosphatase D family protein [Thermoleophilaceae bacterium]|nr:alkaline phosphatase D family protein [Thermoleophilaceae bacterium]
MLRFVGETDAVIWVETDEPCEVEVLGTRARTFCICGHHYGLVCVADLEPGTWHEYEVTLDGERVWPFDDSEFPPSAFRTYPGDGPHEVAFGSCRVAAPHTPPFSLRKDEDERGREIDALYTLARRMRDEPRERWPGALLLLGDQVYADEVSPATLAFVETRRDPDEGPGRRVLDYEEYTRLYRESWSEPTIRWLFSTVPTAMIFDDHDVHDDWNISAAWLEEMRRNEWWHEHVIGALMSYWVYQHLGNLSPAAQQEDPVLPRVRDSEDGEKILRSYVEGADRESTSSRWSYCRDLGRTRVIVIDSRAGRVLEEGERDMVESAEWDWIVEQASGDYDHLLLATSLPLLLGPGMQELEAWSEAVAGGAWGERWSSVAERARRSVDLEHWGAFQRSFHKMVELQRAVGSGERGEAPATIVTLSGDVHHAYLFEIAYPRGSGVKSAVYQAVCSPYRNPLDGRERKFIRFGMSRPFHLVARRLARAAGVKDPGIRWRLTGDGPWFDNQVATLSIEGREMRMRLDKAVPVDENSARLECVLDRRLA